MGFKKPMSLRLTIILSLVVAGAAYVVPFQTSSRYAFHVAVSLSVIWLSKSRYAVAENRSARVVGAYRRCSGIVLAVRHRRAHVLFASCITIVFSRKNLTITALKWRLWKLTV